MKDVETLLDKHKYISLRPVMLTEVEADKNVLQNELNEQLQVTFFNLQTVTFILIRTFQYLDPRPICYGLPSLAPRGQTGTYSISQQFSTRLANIGSNILPCVAKRTWKKLLQRHYPH